MKEHSFKYNTKDGTTEVVNLVPRERGGYDVGSLGLNAVVVQLFEVENEDGTKSYEPVVSISCVDEEMLPHLQEEARRILAP